MAKLTAYIGRHQTLGATVDDEGVNFALFSANAKKVELCVFDNSGLEEIERYEILENHQGVWAVYLEGAKEGLVYGYRVYGAYEPLKGHRFNPNKLLLDPYAKKVVGKLIWDKAIFGYDIDSALKDLSFSLLDSAPYVPKSVVVKEDNYDWGDEILPNTSLEDSIIYEAHVHSATALHPDVADVNKGTFKGFSQNLVINYLKWLGITAVEFLPVHAFLAKKYQEIPSRQNYWGYESLSFFAPEPAYLATGEISEIKDMVKKLHSHNLEVLLDVVYNHTGEGNQMGPTLCYRGIDNASYYTLNSQDKRFYFDSTGCGSSFNVQNPIVLRLIMDSLRYWVDEYHIDGFRFDLATSLCRQDYDFTQRAGFLYAISQDPVLQNVKLIAEPWDVGMGGYQVGAFPNHWSEWNDKYRDVLRRFWKGDNFQIAEVASRVTGSSDIFNYNNKPITTSINFITAHDGFCLRDLVSYNNKHNQANGEDNRDGTDSNWSWNSGAEGETKNKIIRANRYSRAKAMMSSLLLSFGTPMITCGDELCKVGLGNNNPYCQDNILSWINWEGVSAKDKEFTRFVREVIRLRKKLKIFNRIKYFRGEEVDKSGIKDLTWFTSKGVEFATSDWHDGESKAISYVVYDKGQIIFFILNANSSDAVWTFPKLCKSWTLLLDSSKRLSSSSNYDGGKNYNIPSWSMSVFEGKMK